MQDAKHTQTTDSGQKKPYETPTLIEFGLVRDITKGGAGSVAEGFFGMVGMGNMGMGMMM